MFFKDSKYFHKIKSPWAQLKEYAISTIKWVSYSNPTESAGLHRDSGFSQRSKLSMLVTSQSTYLRFSCQAVLADLQLLVTLLQMRTQQLDANNRYLEYTITEESVRIQLKLADAIKGFKYVAK
ncbi:hypothetical protein Tco_0123690 [Tanacetum coccineum]